MKVKFMAVCQRLTASRDRLVYGFFCWFSFAAAAVADRDRLWVDEEIAHELIQRWDVWELLTVLPVWQPHFPTYYLLPELLGWDATAFVSIVSFPITVYATIRAALTLYDTPDAAYVAGALVAMSPFLATQAGWVRMYAPLTAILTLGFCLGLESNYRQAAVCMLFASILHIFGVFGAVWLAIHAFHNRQHGFGVAVGGFGALPASLLLAINTGQQGVTTQSTGMGHGIEPELLRIAVTPVASLLGGPHTFLQVLGVLVVTLLLLVPRVERQVATWILLPVIGVSVASHLVHPVFRLKYFGFVAPVIALLMANPERNRWHRRLIVVLAGILLSLSWIQRLIPVLVTRRIVFWF